MRLHQLRVTAFGPFTDPVEVDFDELGAAGLFLLTGATGAGKSSILDAVCFGLYGEVPGDRHTAKHLRSDQAAPGVAPEVTLEVTLAGRRFRFVRSPAWERPRKKGGPGLVKVQAHVVVEEQRPEGWLALTNRLDEAGHLVTSVLGMTCAQFTQVAMLPQGRFQVFLRASSADRHAVLTRLFRTRRYEDVEKWLVERRLVLGRRSAQHDHAVSALLSRFEEAAGTSRPLAWDDAGLDQVAADGALKGWLQAAVDQARLQAVAAEQSLGSATTDLDQVRSAHDAWVTAERHRQRGAAARMRLAELATGDEAAQAARDRVDSHQRALPVLPLASQAEHAFQRSEQAEREADAAWLKAAPALLDNDDECLPLPEARAMLLDNARDRLAAQRSVAHAFLPRAAELRSLEEGAQSAVAELAGIAARAGVLNSSAEALPVQRTQLRTQLDEAAALATTLADDTAAEQAARAVLVAAECAAELTAALVLAKAELQQAHGQMLTLKEHWLEVKEARINGIAAELASGLTAGCSCPVCGSAEHPVLAHASQTVGRAEEEDARHAYESAEVDRMVHHDRVQTLTTELRLAQQASGDIVGDQARDLLREATETRKASAAAAARVAALRQEGEALDAAEQSLTSQLHALDLEAQAAQTRHDTASDRMSSLAAETQQLLAGSDCPDVETLVDTLDRALVTVAEAHAALSRASAARSSADQASATAHGAALAAGFDDLSGCLAADLGPDEASRLALRLAERDRQRSEAEAVLAMAEVAEALTQEPVDGALLVGRLAELTQLCQTAHARREATGRAVQRLATLATELDDALAAWAPVRADHAVASRLASFVEGKSVDNPLRMRLSAYVLSERLRQVVASANERLSKMSDQRYSLVQVDEKGAGEQRGGLSLQVRDEWNGLQRDPATLSGGETFVVSLALALGLADTVSHEAGGAQVDTLFVDEGFGSLDAETLDDVMDTLDALRDGGRVIGLVSHVAELRTRVTTQLEVRKDRRGSTTQARFAAR